MFILKKGFKPQSKINAYKQQENSKIKGRKINKNLVDCSKSCSSDSECAAFSHDNTSGCIIATDNKNIVRQSALNRRNNRLKGMRPDFQNSNIYTQVVAVV